MDDRRLAELFEVNRAHLRAVAYRMLGSTSEADDAVQEAWLRLGRSGSAGVENLGGWLTTVVSRICLDALRLRKSRREESLGAHAPEPVVPRDAGSDPEHEALLADSVGLAMLVVLDTLAPAERIAFVLHDLFALPFDEIALIVGKSATAARQLASRARRRVQGVSPGAGADRVRKREVIDAFLAASRRGDFAALLAMLDPDAVVRGDAAVVAMGGAVELRGATAVAERFSGHARAAQPAMVCGEPGLVWVQGGVTRVAFAFSFAGGKIVAIDLVADPELLRQVEL